MGPQSASTAAPGAAAAVRAAEDPGHHHRDHGRDIGRRAAGLSDPVSEVTEPDAPRDPDEDRGLARERTALAWTRTALSFGALGGVILKSHVIIGLIVLALVPVVWQVGRLAG